MLGISDYIVPALSHQEITELFTIQVNVRKELINFYPSIYHFPIECTEYAYTLKVDGKSDIYCFGVVLLTEEDAAALKAELNSLQQQTIISPFGSISSPYKSEEQILAMEKEIMDLKSVLQQESVLRQQEQHKLIEEQLRTSTLLAEKQDLEDRLAAVSKKVSEEASEAAAHKAFSLQDKVKLEEQLHDMALMVERLESGRQKLLMECLLPDHGHGSKMHYK